ncbi:MAG: four helix bundle protein [Acidobacteria bacterium]|nr:four helix bundle protein [Acidobacteriota bacterium]
MGQGPGARGQESVGWNDRKQYTKRKQAFINHLSIALGSEGELETCALLAHRFGFMSEADLKRIEAAGMSVRRLLFGLIRSLGRK